jgi:hypothetical protein
MSSTYSQASAASALALNEPVCAPSPFANRMRSVGASSQSIGLAFPATKTCEPSSHPPPMSSAAASPAKTSASPGKPQDWMARAAVYGKSSPESFARYDPGSRLWRTCQLCAVGDSTGFLGTWPRSGMTRNGTAYRLQPLVRLTKGTGSGLWPTPTTVSGHNAGRLDEWGGARARQMISHLPKHERSGPLNPHLPEWLMGYPIDFTDCGPVVTPSLRASQKQSGGPS